MAQITATTGLVSGIDYNSLITKMIQIEAAQSDALTAKNKTLQSQQAALSTLMANLTALRGSMSILGKSSLFNTTTAKSSNTGVISVTTTGIPTTGSYLFTALAKAQAQQLLSSNYESADTALKAGALSLRFGNTVATSINLDNINGGAGFITGKIKITDRNGTANIIDLSAVRTLDDVVTTINNNGLADVTASISGNHIVLTDNTGETKSNLKVQEVNSGKTASSLGLSGINTDTNSATGSDVVSLGNNLNLNALNDGLGVEINNAASDITYKLSNGETGMIKLAGSTTIGDIITKINASSRFLSASLSSESISDKSLMVIKDTSGGKGTFSLTADNDSKALEDLGLTGKAANGAITGTLILSKATGADTVLSTLNGGAGIRTTQPLADFTYTLRNGDQGEIKLAGAKNLGEVIAKINAANTNLKAAIALDGRRLVLNDNSTGAGNFTVADANGSKALDDLGLTGTAVDGVITGSRIISGAKTVLLASLNGGRGLGTLGQINLTDRSGGTATVDLSAAQTLEDVINTINTSGLKLTAQVNDAANGIKIVDTSGAIVSNLKVENAADGANTADRIFGAAVDVAANSANSGDMHLRYIGLNTKLADLNGGAGVKKGSFIIKNSLGASATITINDAMTTVGDVIKAINLSSANVLAEMNDTGDGIAIRDANHGLGRLTVNEGGTTGTAASLNLLVSADTKNSINGSRIVSGMKTVLLSNLNNGNGVGELGRIDLTDRAGNTAVVDLSAAQTLDDVITSINASGLQITAQVNDASNGIKLVDTSNQTTSNLKVQNDADGTTTADKLFGSAVDVAENSANTGDLHFRYIDLNTKLADLNGGLGITQGSFTITNSKGDKADITVNNTIQTVGELITAINNSTANVTAEINSTGDGIVINDLYSGTGKLAVTEKGSTTAEKLGLLQTATAQGSIQTVDGSMTRTINISDTDTLQSLTDTINSLKAGVTASIVSGGTNIYRLQLTSNKTGAQSAFVLDTSQSSMSFDWTTQAQDALLSVGASGLTSKATLFSSSTNSFSDALSGATLNIQSVSTSPVVVTVDADTTTLATQIKSFVNTYNTYRKTLNSITTFDPSTNRSSVLTGSYSTTQVDIQLSKLVSDYFSCGKSISSLGQLGIKFDTDLNDGTLIINEDTLYNTLDTTSLDDVKALFTTADVGISARFMSIIGNLAVDADPKDPKSLLGLQYKALQSSIDKNQENIDSWTKRLEGERTRLTSKFADLEVTLARIQNNYNALNSISWMLDSGSDSSNSLFKNSSSSG